MEENVSQLPKSKLPPWIHRLPWEEICNTCRLHNIPAQLFTAIIMVESSGNPKTAPRYEKKYGYLFKPAYYAELLHISESEERENQKKSWGMCQIMGSVLRELGFGGKLEYSTDIPVNLQYGATKLAQILAKWPYWYDAASAYNHGSPWHDENDSTVYKNDVYVNAVRSYLRSFGITEPKQV
jgi:hypothetical protein